MNISGSYTFDADYRTVWKLLMDPNAIAKAIPGVKEMIPVEGEENSWRAVAKIGLASVSGNYTGLVKLSEIQEYNQYRLTVSGEGQQSIISGTAIFKISPNAEQQKTTVTWDAEANIAGKLASVGQRVIKAAAGLMSKLFFNALAQQIKEAADS